MQDDAVKAGALVPAAGVRLPRRLDGLQVGRGIAAVAVVVSHAAVHPFGGSSGSSLWHMVARYGVTLFFVISGFIMVHTTGDGPFDGRRFFGNRLRRVVPIYYLANALLLGMAVVSPRLLEHTVFDPVHLLFSLLFVPHYSSAGTAMEDLFPFFKLGWTLNYEMFFYISFATLAALTARRRAVVLTVWFGALFLLGEAVGFSAAIPRFYTQIDTLGFVAGIWLGMLDLAGGFRVRRWPLVAGLAATLVGFIALTVELPLIRYSPWTQVAMIGICTVHIAALVVVFDEARVPVPRPLVALGDASYSMYLYHMFAIGAVAAVIRRLPPSLLYPMIAVAAVAGVAIGLVMYQLIERPINRLMRRNRPLTAAQLATDEARAPAAVRVPAP